MTADHLYIVDMAFAALDFGLCIFRVAELSKHAPVVRDRLNFDFSLAIALVGIWFGFAWVYVQKPATIRLTEPDSLPPLLWLPVLIAIMVYLLLQHFNNSPWREK